MINTSEMYNTRQYGDPASINQHKPGLERKCRFKEIYFINEDGIEIHDLELN